MRSENYRNDIVTKYYLGIWDKVETLVFKVNFNLENHETSWKYLDYKNDEYDSAENIVGEDFYNHLSESDEASENLFYLVKGNGVAVCNGVIVYCIN